MEHVSSEIQENKNGRKKQPSTNTRKCYKASKFLRKNDLAKSLFRYEINFYWVFDSKICIWGVFRTQPNISDGIYLRNS